MFKTGQTVVYLPSRDTIPQEIKFLIGKKAKVTYCHSVGTWVRFEHEKITRCLSTCNFQPVLELKQHPLTTIFK